MTAPHRLAVLVAALAAVPVTARQPAVCDVLIANGRVVDGTGAAWVAADVCVRGDRLAAVAPRLDAAATRRLDATGLVVAPGFLDLLGQSEYWVLRDPRVGSKVMQGITTELTGEASFTSVAHPGARRAHPFAAMFDREGVPHWDDLAGYLAVLDAHPATINLGTFISAGGVRESVVGRDDRAATAAELARMEAQVTAAMAAGAFGLSTSLQYVPDRFARTDELVALAKVAGRHGGSYITHQRSEADAIDDSLDEVFRIAREAGVPATIHHLKTAYKQNWGRMPKVLARLEQARRDGLDVAADQYPYVAGSNPLDSSLPVWAREGGRAAMVARLKDPATRARIKAEILQPSTTWENQYLGSGGAAGILVSAVGRAELKRYQGRTLDDIAAAEGKDPLDVLMDLIAEDDTTGSGVMFFMHEDDVRAALRHPLVMLGTDSGGMAPDSGPPTAGVHPRAWGSAARILGHYVRDERLLTLEEAIRKMTSQPAQRMGLWDRGIVRPGAFADLVVFDPVTIRDRATFAAPRQYAEGVRHVLVNGQFVVDDGRLTAARPGRALRGPGAGRAVAAGAPAADPTPVRRVVDDYVGLYTKEALPRWRDLFLPSFTATSPAAGGGATVRTLDQFYEAQARGFARAATMSEALEDVVVERTGRMATARAAFVFHQDGTSRRGRLVLTLVDTGPAWKIASLLFSY
ncbi:MAG: amidohydrolase family protein [Vicinamibacterales bacterium]